MDASRANVSDSQVTNGNDGETGNQSKPNNGDKPSVVSPTTDSSQSDVKTEAIEVGKTDDERGDKPNDVKKSGGKSGSGRRGNRRNNRNRERKPDRSRSPISRTAKSPSHQQSSSEKLSSRRVYFANVAFEVKWSEIKDLFREKVGDKVVQYCQLFEDEQGRSRGCGLVEFSEGKYAKKAIELLHRYNFQGREIVVRDDIDCERDRYGRMVTNGGRRDRDEDRRRGGSGILPAGQVNTVGQMEFGTFNTYGLSPQFLESLGITGGPLNSRIFVANLDYSVTEKKLEEIFRLAGRVLRAKLATDSSGASRGYGTVMFEHPVEAVQCLSMFRNQNLFGRPLSIRMDKYDVEEMPEVLPDVLPAGLEGIGKGLGIGGQPLNVTKYLCNRGDDNMSGFMQQSPIQPSIQPPIQSMQSPAQMHMAPMAPTAGAYNMAPLPAQPSAYGASSGMTPYTPFGQPSGSSTSTQPHTSPVNPSGIPQQQQSNLGYMSSSYSDQNQLGQLSSSHTLNAYSTTAAAPATATNYSISNPIGTQTSLGQPQLGSSVFGSSTYEREFRTGPYRSSLASGPAQAPLLGGTLLDTVLVRNLPPTVTWQALRDRFNEIAEVRFAEIKSRGMAIVTFSSDRDAQRAVDIMNGARIDGRLIEVLLYR